MPIMAYGTEIFRQLLGKRVPVGDAVILARFLVRFSSAKGTDAYLETGKGTRYPLRGTLDTVPVLRGFLGAWAICIAKPEST